MSAQIIYGTDFKRPNPKADRAFWIGPSEDQIKFAHELADERRRMWADTAPCELCGQDGDCV